MQISNDSETTRVHPLKFNVVVFDFCTMTFLRKLCKIKNKLLMKRGKKMKKRVHRIVTLLFIVFSIIAGGAPIVAANNAIRPDINGSGTLTIHKHWAEDNSQIGSEGNGKEQTVDNSPVEGVVFNIYELTPMAGNEELTPPSEKDGAVYEVNSDRTELTITFKGNTYKYAMGLKQTGTTDSTGVYKFEGLEGFYYVEEDLAMSNPTVNGETVKIVTPAKPFIVSVPMTNPNGDGWFKDIHVYPKNQGMTPEKTVNNGSGNSVNIGDKLDFGIKVAIPSDIGDSEYKVFNINDKLDEALTYLTNSTKVYAYKFVNSIWEKVEVTTGVNPVFTAGTNTISVEFTEAGRAELARLMTQTGGNYTHVGIEFSANVNENVLSKPNYTVKNQGEIEWNNTPGDETEKIPTTETETNTGDVEIDKEDQSGADLKDAEFQIAATKEDAENGNKYIKVKVDSNDKITDIVYPGDADYNTALNWIIRPHADAGELGVDDDTSTFYANKFQALQTHTGTDDKKEALKYYVVETKTPEGYNLLDAPVEVNFEEENSEHIVTKKIVNSHGFKLPNTGSLGMIVLTIVGIILIGLAILMFLPKKRRS